MLNQDTTNKINNLIFSSLAKGDKVFIEGIGTLSPKIVMATVSSKKPPIAKKIITLFRDCCGDDLHVLIGTLEGITKENIDYIYSQWLSEICISAGPIIKEYDVKSVIYIKLDTVKGTVTITPSNLLDKALNPFSTEESVKEIKKETKEAVQKKIKDGSKRKFNLSLLIAISLFLIFAIAAAFILMDTVLPNLFKKEIYSEETSPIVKDTPVEKPEPVITKIEEPVVTPPIEENSSPKEITAPQGRYYLIIGSFSTVENSIELFITLKNKGYNPYTMPSSNGKMTMVSIMDFDTEEEAIKKRKNNDFNYDCWVYHKTK